MFGIAEEGLGLTRFVDGNGWLLLPCSLVDSSAMRMTLVGFRVAKRRVRVVGGWKFQRVGRKRMDLPS